MEFAHYAQPISRGLLGVGLMAVAVAIGMTHWPISGPSTPAPLPAVPSPVSTVNGLTTIRLDAAAQSRSGIEIEALTPMSHRAETPVYGNVLDLQPLIELRGRYEAARADAAAAHAVAAASQADWERSRALYEDQRNVSLKVYQAALANYRADQAKADAAAAQVLSIESSLQHQFGRTLAGWTVQPNSPAFAGLLSQTDVLVRLTLPPTDGKQAAPRVVDVQIGGGRRMRGSLVSAAAQTDPGTIGTSFIYRVPAALASGAAVVGYLPTTSLATNGAFVPSGAVVWFAGQPWVYVQEGPARFVRQPLGNAGQVEGGYVATNGLRPDERVVARGAGLLLSEEQRPPPGGAGCKDPECD
jgi:membrane fusion protein, multidrug efflux system